MGDYIPDHWLASLIYAPATLFSWAKALAVPGVQAAANIKVLQHQNKQYRELRRDQRSIITAAIEGYANRMDLIGDDLKSAYPTIPKVARYTPVDPCVVSRDTLDCNISVSQRAADWAKCVSQLNNQADIAKMVFFDPKWVENVDMYSMTVGDLLRGRMPVDYNTPVLSDTVELTAFERRNGKTGYKTARFFGLGENRMKSVGRDELFLETGMLETLSPVGRLADMRDLLDTPERRIAFSLTQAQLIQNSLQNLFNQQAQKPPAALARLNLRLERAINMLQLRASKANIAGSPVPNYAAILQPQINAVARGIGSFFNSGSDLSQGSRMVQTDQNPYPPQVLPTK